MSPGKSVSRRTRRISSPVALLALVCVVASAADTRAVRDATRLFRSGCAVGPEEEFDRKVCQSAFEVLKTAIRTNPSSAELHFMYGAAELELNTAGGYSDGLAHVKTAIRINPGLAEAYYYLLFRERLRDEDRVELLRTLLRHRPDEGEAYIRLIFELGLHPSEHGDELLRVYRKYRLVKPFSPTTAGDLSGDRDAAEALATIGRVGDSADIYQGVIDYAHKGGNLVWACSELRDVSSQRYQEYPRFRSALEHIRDYCTHTEHYERAIRVLADGDRAEAVQELERQMQVNPLYPYTYPKLASLYLESGRPEDAARVFAGFLRGEFGLSDKCQLLQTFPDVSRHLQSGDSSVSAIQRQCEGAR